MKPSTKHRLGQFWTTVKQAIFVWFLSFLPILIAAGWQVWVTRGDDVPSTFLGAIGGNFRGGEAFLYVASFVAPFFWTVLAYNDASKRMPWQVFPLVGAILALLVSAFLFAAHRANPDSGVAQIPYIGIVLYLIGFLIWIKSMHDERVLPTIPDVNKASRERQREISDGL
jgi:hypothetical protein